MPTGWLVRSRGLAAALVLLLSLVHGAAALAGGPKNSDLLPVVFVHGSSGSAQQFQTHAMRFTSNGYPQRLLYAFEYDTSVGFEENGEQVLADLDAFMDRVLAETDARKVNAIGHSRGTTVMTTYLDNIAGASDKVARYVNIDGRAPDALPGGVPTIGIWGEWNSGGERAIGGRRAQIGPNPADNYYFPEKSHTEVATSAEAFALMYEHFTGKPPRTTDVVPQPPGWVTIAGRALVFPQNVGYAGGELAIWRVDPDTGHRVGWRPVATRVLEEGGHFGPIRVHGGKSYELALTREDGSVHHFYQEPFARSDHFVRLNTSRPGTGIGAFIPTADDNAALVITRQREFWGDQGQRSDMLTIDGLSILDEVISPRSNVNLAVFTFDAGNPGTDLSAGVPSPFGFLAFLTAADVYIPATMPPTGRVEIGLLSRGRTERQVINVPNWASSNHRVTVQFRDHVQAAYAYQPYVRERLRALIEQLREAFQRYKAGHGKG